MKRLFSFSTLIYLALSFGLAYYLIISAPNIDFSQRDTKIAYVLMGLSFTFAIEVVMKVIKEDK